MCESRVPFRRRSLLNRRASWTSRPDVDVFGGINKRLRGVGLASVACCYIVVRFAAGHTAPPQSPTSSARCLTPRALRAPSQVTYYFMLLSWVARAFFASFGEENFWSAEVTASEAGAYFRDVLAGMAGRGPDAVGPTRMVWENAGCSAFTWTCVYLCIAFGIKWTGRIVGCRLGLRGTC